MLSCRQIDDIVKNKRSKMKLKNKVFSAILGMVASSVLFISVPESANAAECSASDPCHTYAMLDNANNVINVIVCQPSVCGSGTFAGHRVVLQVVANPQTNNPSGTSGHMTRPDENKVVTYSDNGVFTVKKDDAVTHTVAVPEVQTQITNNTTTTTITSIQAQFIDTSTGSVKIDASQTIDSTTVTSGSTVNSTNTVKETVTFEERKTEQEVSTILVEKNLILLQSRINRLLILLSGWLL
jgi:hypothetical protein